MKKEPYSTKIYKDTLVFALKAHSEQKTPDGLPYAFHIVSVANEIINSLFINPLNYDEANIAIACALLHDVNEDTDVRVSRSNIKFLSNNIDTVISGVEALTKDSTIPKDEQLKDSIKRLKQQPKCVQMVKLADRITNLAPAPLFWNRAKRKTYVDEAKYILQELGSSNNYLAKKLQNKIKNYEVDKNDNYLLFLVDEKQLILDKSNKNYLKTFKTLNRLNEYLLKNYNIMLFESWKNIEAKELDSYTNRLNISYIKNKLNEKKLLNSNQTINNYFENISEAKDVIKC